MPESSKAKQNVKGGNRTARKSKTENIMKILYICLSVCVCVVWVHLFDTLLLVSVSCLSCSFSLIWCDFILVFNCDVSPVSKQQKNAYRKLRHKEIHHHFRKWTTTTAAASMCKSPNVHVRVFMCDGEAKELQRILFSGKATTTKWTGTHLMLLVKAATVCIAYLVKRKKSPWNDATSTNDEDGIDLGTIKWNEITTAPQARQEKNKST